MSSVRKPRSDGRASNGPMTAPNCVRMVLIRSQAAPGAAAATAPAMTSEWPLRYFDAECMTRSAPSRSGRVRTGVATVELTASRAPAAWAIAAIAAMSLMGHSGLPGVST